VASANNLPNDPPSPPTSPAVQNPSPRRLGLVVSPLDKDQQVRDKFSFPPTPVEAVDTPTTPSRIRPARAGSSALSRALNLATKKLWGTGTPSSQNSPTLVSGPAGTPITGYPPVQADSPLLYPASNNATVYATTNGSPRLSNGSPRQILGGSPRAKGMEMKGPLLNGDLQEGINPSEEKLLAGLENLAQKVEVITKWADELFEMVKAIPQSMSYESTGSHQLI
jgi:serine/threonine-protein kinase ULK2